MTAVVAEALTKRFGSLVAVDDLSFTLKPGTITGFLEAGLALILRRDVT
jgi:ABC-type multidrug transport system ATPase subunit